MSVWAWAYGHTPMDQSWEALPPLWAQGPMGLWAYGPMGLGALWAWDALKD